MEAIPIEELKSEKTPRISAEDLIELCELAGPASTRSPSKKTVKSKPKILIIDVRSPDEYPLFGIELMRRFTDTVHIPIDGKKKCSIISD